MTNHNVLYRIYNKEGALLYVGATTNPSLRFNYHAQNRLWWGEASEIKLQHCGSVDELAEAELTAIQTEKPKFNLLHSKPATWSRKPRQRRAGGGTVFQRSADDMWVGGITINGVQKRVYSRSREECEQKLEALKIEFGC